MAIFLKQKTYTVDDPKPTKKTAGGKKRSRFNFLRRGKDEKVEENQTIGGGFRTALTRSDQRHLVSNRSGFTADLSLSDSSESNTKMSSWSSSGSRDYHRHAPLFVKPPMKQVLEREGSSGAKKVHPTTDDNDEAAQLGQIMARGRQLPGTWYYSSNHVMINKERVKRNIPALARRIELDTIARERAEAMAKAQSVEHGDAQDLQFQLYPCRRFGENVASGSSIRDIHKVMLEDKADMNNILDRRYAYMGVGTSLGEDGTLYLCQIFKG